MTDNEIITAMEDYRNSPIIFTKNGIISIGDILDLINRQQAEIERLKESLETSNNVIKNTFLLKAGLNNDIFAEIKSKAIQEFAEKVLGLFPSDKNFTTINRFTIKQICDHLVGDTE